MSLPNYITLLRILLIPFFFTELLSYEPGKEYHRWLACGVFFLASMTDAIDGFLARFMNSQTDLGRFLDPVADKLLLLSGYLGLLFVTALPYRPPLWITVSIVFRDILIVAGLISIYLVSGRMEIKPNFLGKLTTAFQMLTLIAILCASKISVPLWYVTAFFTMASCLSYIIRDFVKLRL